ncbi:MAG: hypothetical protein RLZZ127_284 [Planctomycetota bacterium]|jgi:glucans biosynthesis protein
MRATALLLAFAAVLPAADPLDAAAAAARETLAAPFVPGSAGLPESLDRLGYDAYRGLRQDPAKRLWIGQGPFQLGWFHRGGLAKDRVRIFLEEGAGWKEHAYDPGEWTIHPELQKELPAADLRPDLGFAGFKLWSELNRPGQFDEVVSFIGASYFRPLGRGHIYGASCRGLGLRVGRPDEEFPRFSAFWIERAAADGSIRFAALLDGPGVVGAYRFVMRPGLPTTLDVEARITARSHQREVLLAPVTSMFLWDGVSGPRLDFRPEVHDSDGLLVAHADGRWTWRPLINRVGIPESTFPGPVRGYGLLQRDRRYESYHDQEALYHQRPGMWIEPAGEWPAGQVWLLEHPTVNEGYDSTTVGWRLAEPLASGATLTVRYRISAVDDVMPNGLLRVADSAMVKGPQGPMGRILFAGDSRGPAPVAVVETSAGRPPEAHVIQAPGGWEVRLLKGDAIPFSCWSVRLMQDGKPRSEAWQYPWHP